MQNTEEAEGAHQALVFFDLETTGLGPNCEIVQLAAVSGGHSLNLYIVPRRRMERGAVKVTGFKVHRQRLYLHRQPVLTNSLREVLVSFIAFLQMLGRPLVIGHNIRQFDCPLLARTLNEFDLRTEFEASVSGYVDTLPLAREVLKDCGLQSFRQENLVRELLGVNYKAHDALEDVRALQALYNVLRPKPEVICRHRFTLDTMCSKPAVTAAKVPCRLPGQRPLWEHFKQTVRLTDDHNREPDTLLNQPLLSKSDLKISNIANRKKERGRATSLHTGFKDTDPSGSFLQHIQSADRSNEQLSGQTEV